MSDAPNQGFSLVGVAPEVNNGIYPVFRCGGNSGDDINMAAMQQAAKDSADVISMSLGSLSYRAQASAYLPLAQNIVKSGVAVIDAPVNDGDLGPYAVSTPGQAPEVLAVGSAESEIYPTVYKVHSCSDLSNTLLFTKFVVVGTVGALTPLHSMTLPTQLVILRPFLLHRPDRGNDNQASDFCSRRQHSIHIPPFSWQLYGFVRYIDGRALHGRRLCFARVTATRY